MNPWTSLKEKIRGTKEMSTQPQRLFILKGVAVPKSTEGKDEEEDEIDMAFLRKIDNTSFVAYLSAYVLFNCYYWMDMMVF